MLKEDLDIAMIFWLLTSTSRFRIFISFLIYFNILWLFNGCGSSDVSLDLSSKNEAFFDSLFLNMPYYKYENLLKSIQQEKVFPNERVFLNASQKLDSKIILENFTIRKNQPDFQLRDFVLEHFEIKKVAQEQLMIKDTANFKDFVFKEWESLITKADPLLGDSKIPLPFPYLVSNQALSETYYGDSYFKLLGVASHEEGAQILESCLDNFAFLINRYGFIPSGDRTFYFSRSHPPFFALLVELLAELKGNTVYQKYQEALLKEYSYWMDGAEQLTMERPSYRRVVRLAEGVILNRYWDDVAFPRSEFFLFDKSLTNRYLGSDSTVYRNIRASAESQWLNASRWQSSEGGQSKIITVDIIPVDLNSLLYHHEIVLAKGYKVLQDPRKAAFFLQKAEIRKTAINHYCWVEKHSFFVDYNFKKLTSTNQLVLAGVYPMFFNIATQKQAFAQKSVLENQFLKTGGLQNSLEATGGLWDAPFGAGHLQWMTTIGLQNYGFPRLGNEIKERWINTCQKSNLPGGPMLDHFNVVNLGEGKTPLELGDYQYSANIGVLHRYLNE